MEQNRRRVANGLVSPACAVTVTTNKSPNMC